MLWRNCSQHLIGPFLCKTNPLYHKFTAQSFYIAPSILSPLWWVGARELMKPYEHQHEQPASWPDSSLLRKPPHVSNHRGPSWTVPASQCTALNAKPGERLHVVDTKWQAANQQEILWPSASFLERLSHCHHQSDVMTSCWGSCVFECLCGGTQRLFISWTSQFQVSSQDCWMTVRKWIRPTVVRRSLVWLAHIVDDAGI